MIRSRLQEITLDDYDRLIQLCDAISGAEGVMDTIDRMSDVKRLRMIPVNGIRIWN